MYNSNSNFYLTSNIQAVVYLSVVVRNIYLNENVAHFYNKLKQKHIDTCVTDSLNDLVINCTYQLMISIVTGNCQFNYISHNTIHVLHVLN